MYKTFISVVFGFCLGLIFIPLDAEAIESDGIVQTANIAAIMVTVVMSLWWWYAIFFARVCPADSPALYFLDIACLVTVALAGRMWRHPDLWIVIAFVAILFLLSRFCLVILANQGGCQFLRSHMGIRLRSRKHDKANGKPRWLLKTDIHVIVCAVVALFFCLFACICFAIGSGELFSDQQRRLSLAQAAFLAAILAGVVYTLYVALFVPTVSQPWIEAKTSEQESGHVRREPEDRLVGAYNVVERDEMNLRLERVRTAHKKFRAVLREHLPDRSRWESASLVHSTRDVEVQAFAMGLRFPAAQTDLIELSSKVTFFIHWIDDLFDAGALRPAVRRWLEEEYNATQKSSAADLLGTSWDRILRRQRTATRTADQDLIRFIENREEEISGEAAHRFFRFGLRRLAMGSVLLNEPKNSGFHEWLLKLHADAFVVVHELHEETIVESTLSSLDQRTLALTSKPIQECWDAVAIDNRTTTALMNVIYSVPAFYHNARLEQKHGELASEWDELIRSDVFASDLQRVLGLFENDSANMSSLVSQARVLQLNFVLTATSTYVDEALRSAITDAVKSLDSRNG